MKRTQCQMTEEDRSEEPPPPLILGIPDSVTIMCLLPLLLPRELGALRCVSRWWKRAVPRSKAVCYANALVPKATRCPAVFDYDDLSDISVFLLEELGVASDRDDLLSSSSITKLAISQFVYMNLGTCETYHDPEYPPKDWELPCCTTCDDEIREETYSIISMRYRVARGGRDSHTLDLDFHQNGKCDWFDDIIDLLWKRVQALMRQIVIDRYRIHRPRGYVMPLAAFRKLVNSTVNLRNLRNTTLGSDAREQDALWDVYTEYPPPRTL